MHSTLASFHSNTPPPATTKTAAQYWPLLMLLLLLTFGRSTIAAEFCVGTAAELEAALIQAASPSQALFTTTIMLKQGTYNVAASRLTQFGQARFNELELLGGHNSDCSTRTVNPDNTVFDAGGATFVYFRALSDLLIEGIRFQNFTGARQVDIRSEADDVTVRVHNNAFVGVMFFATSVSFDGVSMRFINNRVHGVPGSNFAAVYLAAWTQIRITGNTISDNLSDNAVRLCANSSNDVWFVDNIAWNNVGTDFVVFDDCSNAQQPGNARNRSNLYQSVSLVQIGDSGSNLVGTDPLFVNAAAGNYRLQNTSPAVNTGVVSSSMANIDLAGNPRVVGSTVDRGAYESALNDTIPSTITVTTASDSGAGSLRQAILDANVNTDFNFINFNIPGACPRVIVLTSADLPSIVNGVRIDGWSQPGSVTNTGRGDNATRCIVLAGFNTRRWGLNFAGASDEQFWLQGLAFSGFKPGSNNGAALRVAGGTGNLILGNQFGGSLSSNAGALTLLPSDTNIELTGPSKSTVGGDTPAQRNVIADAAFNGVLITSTTFLFVTTASTDNDIIDNLIGSYGGQITSPENGNRTGIRIETSGNTVRDNTIIHSGQDGIWMEASGAHQNVIRDNLIGIRARICAGTFCFGGPAGNGRHGVYLLLGPHDNIILNNTIKNNTGTGIFIASGAGATSQKNWLIGNRLYNNGGAGTGFIAYNGADNDASPAQLDMANRGRNYPVLTRAYGGAEQGIVEGMLNTTNGSYVIDIFSSAQPDSGFPRGEAEVFHKSFFSVTVNNAVLGQNGSTGFSIAFPSTLDLAGRVITVTATDSVGNTSELSAPVVYTLSDNLFANGFEN